MSLEVSSVRVRRGGVDVVTDVSFTVAPGRTMALLGPSGAGKSSLLLAVAGLLPVAGGTVRVRGEDVTTAPPERRDVGLMFQEFALFPHLSVRANVAYGPRMRGVGRGQREADADLLLERVGLAAYGDRDVATLSGGQRQRVALARALATEPAVLLLDEPLGALDRQLREQLLAELRALVDDGGPALVTVTHDRDEALSFGDTVGVLRDGRLVQAGPPDSLVARPVDAWTARFLGHETVLDRAGAAVLGLVVDGPVVVPSTAVQVDPDGDGWDVVDRSWRAGMVHLVLRRDAVEVTALVPPGAAPGAGARCGLGVDPEATVPLPREDGV